MKKDNRWWSKLDPNIFTDTHTRKKKPWRDGEKPIKSGIKLNECEGAQLSGRDEAVQQGLNKMHSWGRGMRKPPAAGDAVCDLNYPPDSRQTQPIHQVSVWV